ncbi:MAG: acetolactate synthase [Gammaproteobacteria bacterium]|nr:MAG: acetolactate synthase [Gammaproteobacteria bacterium]
MPWRPAGWGVCCATTGPGATNAITGVAAAYDNDIPLLVLTAQTPLGSFGRGAFQDSSDTGINTLGLFQHCTRYNTLVSHPAQLECKLYAAVLTAFDSGAPAHLSLPMDVLRAPCPQGPRLDVAGLRAVPHGVDEAGVQALAARLGAARRVLFVLGEGSAPAAGLLATLAWRLPAEVVTTPHGKGMISPFHPCFRGVIGFAGHRSALAALENPELDLVVAVGTGLSEWTADCWDDRARLGDRLVHVDVHPRHFARSPAASLHVLGPPERIFERVLAALEAQGRLTARPAPTLKTVGADGEAFPFLTDDPESMRAEGAPIKPQRLMVELARRFPPQTIWLADVGNSFAWATHYLHPYDRRITGPRGRDVGMFRACFDFAPMGWAIGAAVGVALGRRGQPVVCITGDGSWLMNGQEITVAAEQGLPILYVVLNDAALGMVRHGQRANGAESIGWKLPRVDYAAMARSLGIAGYVIESPEDFFSIDVEAFCSGGTPILIDARIDPEESPPLGLRLRSLQKPTDR